MSDPVRAALVHRNTPADSGPNYQAHLLEQYKLFVEMADRVSARRMQANTFSLAANTGLFTVLASPAKDKILSVFVPRLFGLLYLLLLLLAVMFSRSPAAAAVLDG